MENAFYMLSNVWEVVKVWLNQFVQLYFSALTLYYSQSGWGTARLLLTLMPQKNICTLALISLKPQATLEGRESHRWMNTYGQGLPPGRPNPGPWNKKAHEDIFPLLLTPIQTPLAQIKEPHHPTHVHHLSIAHARNTVLWPLTTVCPLCVRVTSPCVMCKGRGVVPTCSWSCAISLWGHRS